MNQRQQYLPQGAEPTEGVSGLAIRHFGLGERASQLSRTAKDLLEESYTIRSLPARGAGYAHQP